MMRKKQISKMLIGTFVACMATACSNETEVLSGFPTNGNTLSVNLRTNDIGAATRAIATPAESEVTSLSAYLFDQNEAGSYALEKVYNNLTWNADDETHTVALTGIQERGPKKIYFVANGTTINALNGTTEGLSEEDFQALLMNLMEANPSTPLPMTAQAELAEWNEGVNNANITEPAQLKRVSARIDLQVDEQAGLTFQPTGITLASAAQSYIFPNETVCEDDKTVEISGATLYPYESAAGTVKEVKVTGIVTVGSTEKEAVFTVPFVNDDYTDGIAIERNHRYTVRITRINGFYSAEATITVSDWSAADYSGNLQAGEELIMTATESIDGQLTADATATAVYPDNDSKKATVTLTAEDAKVYRIYVGSANIETATTYILPEGWSMAPANTRTEYLWKEYWTLTIPANESQEAKSMTIKAANKLELAKDANTEKFVEITFTQEGKEEETPALSWAPANTRSWVDAVTYNDDAYILSYIPTVPLQDQGIKLVYSNKTVFSDTDNPYAFHYQWDRDFGFVASTEAFDMADTKLPNSHNIPSSIGPVYGGYYEKGLAPNIAFGINNFDMFIYPNNSQSSDWCAASRTTWGNRWSTYGFSAAPQGYHIPTTAEWETLFPEGVSGKTYTYASKGYAVEGGTSYPFYAKQENGKTKVWSMHQTHVKKYMEVRTINGKYTLESLTSDVLNLDTNPLQLPADGYRTSRGVVQWQERGLYWSAESSRNPTPGRSVAFSFTIDTTQRSIRISMGEQPRKYAFSIRCIKDNE
ncbi:MAG: FimB/Mfa2 family fimbrial subunit [Bacteroides sp.]|nr:FimB/Mfa2 family fimbrial subunit [Bacteroides sp.]